MKVKISNLGAIKQAEFELGELTIICGENNTGKSYITHGLYGLLDYLRHRMEFSITDEKVEYLFQNGSVEISLEPYITNINKYLAKNCQNYSDSLAEIFAGNKKNFHQSQMMLSMGSDLIIDHKIQRIISRQTTETLSCQSVSKNLVRISLIATENNTFSKEMIKDMIVGEISFIIKERLFPNVFLSSAERTGASIFQKELDFTRNRLIDVLQTDISIGSQLIGKFSNTYPLAIKKNVDFIREMPLLSKKESYIAQQHPHILAEFADIIGGNYHISQDGDIRFQPKDSKKNIRLALHESSSAVRSLLDIGFYLRHVAQKGDLLMVDEPELNLHPQNQRRVARLFAQLINIGIKVFITTHSDYIIKELNTLIMFNQGGERLESLAEQEGYQQSEFLDPNKVRVYIAEKALIKVDDSTKRKRCNTLVQANIDSEYGIEARSFDTTIEEMNRIQEEIVWGE